MKKTREYQITRTNLFSGLLKLIFNNKGASLPLKVFEVSDIVIKNDQSDVGAINKRNLCALYCDTSSGYEVVHGLLDRVMALNKVQCKDINKPLQHSGLSTYYLKPSEDPTFLPGRRADIILNEQKIGVIGVIHPEVLDSFKIPYPISGFEICIEHFV